MTSPRYYAHSANSAGQWQTLADHLRQVAALARSFSAPLGFADEANLAGVLHDLGKYGDLFQRRLHGKEHGLDHWTPGAALTQRSTRMLAACAAILGHHCGLPVVDLDQMRNALNLTALATNHPQGLRITGELDELQRRLLADGLCIPASPSIPCLSRWPGTIADMLDLRMLYSTLVDADYLDTEAHFLAAANGTPYQRPAGSPLQPERALEILLAHLQTLQGASAATSSVQQMRDALLADCLHAGDEAMGVRTLTAPTGAGKTLAMLAFALRHAATHGLRRIVMVIPYLSIIEQTAAIYRALFAPHFGPDYVLEHHSLARGTDDGDERNGRLLAENWDAPLIVTTNVQMLESLFAARPAACRKLHRLAESVFLFDEVQSLPEELAVPTLAALSHLSARYRSTVVFSTATQPAFAHLDKAVRELGSPGWQPREIVADPATLFAHTKHRVTVQWPDTETGTPLAQLAQELAALPQVLCIVNVKRHAYELVAALRAQGTANVYHLSTSMCPAHRQACLAEVKRCLEQGIPCRLIATQCVEAGVDIDFPCVYRAFAPLEAIAQAAGRCNRHGTRDNGEVRVFLPAADGKRGYPSCDYQRVAGITNVVLKERGVEHMDISDPELYTAYYRRRYNLTEPETQCEKLDVAVGNADFPTVADSYQLIEQNTITVLTCYDREQYRQLADDVRAHGLRADWIRRAQPFTVAIPRPANLHTSSLEPCPIDVRYKDGTVSNEWFIAPENGSYDSVLGYIADDPTVLCL